MTIISDLFRASITREAWNCSFGIKRVCQTATNSKVLSPFKHKTLNWQFGKKFNCVISSKKLMNSKWLWWIDKHQLLENVWIDFDPKYFLKAHFEMKSFLCGLLVFRQSTETSCGILSRNLTRVYVRLKRLFVNIWLIIYCGPPLLVTSTGGHRHPDATSAFKKRVYWHEFSIKCLLSSYSLNQT
jgi:hypothetical protein